MGSARSRLRLTLVARKRPPGRSALSRRSLGLRQVVDAAGLLKTLFVA